MSLTRKRNELVYLEQSWMFGLFKQQQKEKVSFLNEAYGSKLKGELV